MKERAALLGGEVLFTRGPEHDIIVTARMPQGGMPLQTKGLVCFAC